MQYMYCINQQKVEILHHSTRVKSRDVKKTLENIVENIKKLHCLEAEPLTTSQILFLTI